MMTVKVIIVVPLILLLAFFSSLILSFETAAAQNQIQPLSDQQIQQFISNGTSFDGFIKKKAVEFNTTGSIHLKATTSNKTSESELLNAVNMCMSLLGQAFAAIMCDLSLSILYEVCQVIPDMTPLVCQTPTLGNYLLSRNIPDGQTDKMAWLFLLHVKELANSSSSSPSLYNNNTVNKLP
jgi:hypothetical protein